MIIVSGIADEAGQDIETQIRAHKTLGWQAIELRLVGGKNVAGALSDDAFDAVAAAIDAAGLQVTCFASAIGNWSRHIQDDFAQDVDELKTAIPRMHRLGTTFIRTMSWVGKGVPEAEWRDEGIRRYKELTRIAEDGGVTLAHENCTGWAGLCSANMRRLIETVDSRHLAVLFDIGNTVGEGYEHWPFYEGVKDLIRYVHIKDCKKNPQGGLSEDYTYPGQGDAMVRETLADLVANGYDGVVSIEPHVASVIHTGAENALSEEQKFDSYIRYGQMAYALATEARSARNDA